MLYEHHPQNPCSQLLPVGKGLLSHCAGVGMADGFTGKVTVIRDMDPVVTFSDSVAQQMRLKDAGCFFGDEDLVWTGGKPTE